MYRQTETLKSAAVCIAGLYQEMPREKYPIADLDMLIGIW
jgi:hypothetical protein